MRRRNCVSLRSPLRGLDDRNCLTSLSSVRGLDDRNLAGRGAAAYRSGDASRKKRKPDTVWTFFCYVRF